MSRQPAEEIANNLDRAADHMDNVGKCRFMHADDQGRCCALGAIAYVITGNAYTRDPAPWPTQDAFADQVSRDYNTGVVAFSDGTSDKRKVTRALRRTARKLRGAKR